MKKIILVVLLGLFLACGQKEGKKPADPVAEGPKLWLTFEGKDPAAKHIVLVSGDEEYRSEEALPQLAKILSSRHGFNCTVLFAQDPARPGTINANYVKNIPGLEALDQADMMVIFTRFRALPDAQMQHIDAYLKKGKPVLGIRTATHAFNFDADSLTHYKHYSNGYAGDQTAWTDGFGRLVLGEKWISHHGNHKHQSTRGMVAEVAKANPIANGLMEGEIWGSTDVYGVRLPLPGDAKPIVLGQVMNRTGEYDENDLFYGMRPTDDQVADRNEDGEKLNDPMMPIAWTKTYQLPGGQAGRAFTSTIGSSSDMRNEGVRRLLVNGLFWAMQLPVPEKADVTVVGDYRPSAYGFKTDAYWKERQLKVSDFE
ncbi:MAG: hypothetical protein E4H26_10780 [Flavobacteriales bacterium]|nr:MAG: hypothetical protein E4H26_10780 [Flavobacteriales bacterium]